MANTKKKQGAGIAFPEGQGVDAGKGWMTTGDFASLHGVTLPWVQGKCRNAGFPADAIKKVPYRATGVWLIRDGTPCPSKRRCNKKAAPQRKLKAPRAPSDPQRGDGADGREEFIPKLEALVEKLSESPGHPAAQSRLLALLVNTLGRSEIADRFGITPDKLSEGLTTTKLESKAIRIANGFIRDLRRSLREDKKGGFVMPQRGA